MLHCRGLCMTLHQVHHGRRGNWGDGRAGRSSIFVRPLQILSISKSMFSKVRALGDA